MVKTTFQATDPDVYVYDPTHALNYGLKEWGDTYQSFYRCLTSFSKMASEDCKHLDSFFQDVVEEEKYDLCGVINTGDQLILTVLKPLLTTYRITSAMSDPWRPWLTYPQSPCATGAIS